MEFSVTLLRVTIDIFWNPMFIKKLELLTRARSNVINVHMLKLFTVLSTKVSKSSFQKELLSKPNSLKTLILKELIRKINILKMTGDLINLE